MVVLVGEVRHVERDLDELVVDGWRRWAGLRGLLQLSILWLRGRRCASAKETGSQESVLRVRCLERIGMEMEWETTMRLFLLVRRNRSRSTAGCGFIRKAMTNQVRVVSRASSDRDFLGCVALTLLLRAVCPARLSSVVCGLTLRPDAMTCGVWRREQ